jgi:adenylyl cyclase-associated protein
MLDAAQFYTNRVLKDFKEKDPIHIEWVKQWIKILNQLHNYVKQYHTDGLTWNYSNTSHENAFSNLHIDANPSGNGVMTSINRLGTSATSHLKKASDEQNLPKNPHLKQQTIQPSNNISSNDMPKLALEGNKWIVEYYSNRKDLKITDTNMRQTIYIYKCTNSTIVIQGKVNSIVLDQCSKVGIQFTSVVSLIEFINCHSIKAQVLESVPTIQIEKTDGCHIYLSKTSLNTEFITSKSSEMTINVPSDDGEYKELPIPEQFKTYIQKGKQLMTIPNQSAGV